MDNDKDVTRVKFAMGALTLFLLSAYFAYDELCYALWGKTVQASVVQAKPYTEMGRRGGQHQLISVEYSFPGESGTMRTERDSVPPEWPLVGHSVLVQYIPDSPDSSRIAGHRNMGSVYVFLGGLVVMAGIFFFLYREAKASERRPVRRSR